MLTTGTSCYNVPFGVGFAAAFARFLLGRYGVQHNPAALAGVVVWVPSSRVALAVEEALVKAMPQGLVLPKVQPMALNEEDAEPLLFDLPPTQEDLPSTLTAPPLPEVQEDVRLTYLAQQVFLWQKAAGLQKGASYTESMRQAYSNALSLVQLSNRLVAHGVPFRKLEAFTPADVASHWQQSLAFLKIVFDFYPQWLAASGVADPATLKAQRLQQQTAFYKANPAAAKSAYIAGFADTTPHGLALMQAIMAAGGCFVTQGVEEALLNHPLPPTHPQYTLNRLLKALGMTTVAPLGGEASPWVQLLQLSQVPALQVKNWASAPSFGAEVAEHLTLLEAPTPRLEAEAIALYMRHTLEQSEETCALITADRSLAARVADRLQTLGILVDDSAGKPLPTTPAGSFFLQLMAVVVKGFAPTTLAQLLSHPFTTCGQERGAWKTAARVFEVRILRGVAPSRGLIGIGEKIAHTPFQREDEAAQITHVFTFLQRVYAPFLGQKKQTIAQWAKDHFALAQAFCAPYVHEKNHEKESEKGALPLFRGEDGASLATQLEQLNQHPQAEKTTLAEYYALLEVLLTQITVRPKRYQHPRLFIWGPLEARLQDVGTVIIGGLNEGAWPNTPTPDPWINRDAAQHLGLPLPEMAAGLNARDFCALASAKKVLLTRPVAEGGVETIPSRHLLRLQAVLSFHEGVLQAAQNRGQTWLTLAKQALVQAPQVPKAVPACVLLPQGALPRVWSPSSLTQLIACPYKLYSAKVLGVEPLPPFDEMPDAAEKGKLTHKCFEAFYKTTPGLPPAFGQTVTAENKPQALAHLHAMAQGVFAALPHGPSRVVWQSRFNEVAKAFIDTEAQNTAQGRTPWRVEIVAEGTLAGLNIKAQADRIDHTPQGYVLMDYKTGSVPKRKEVFIGRAPQLALEALLLEEGAFGQKSPAVGVEYWKVGGGTTPFKKELDLTEKDMPLLLKTTQEGLQRLATVLGANVVNMPAAPAEKNCQWCPYSGLCRQHEWATVQEEGGSAV